MSVHSRRSLVVAAAVVLAAAMTLTGCGRRGSLDPPPDAEASRDPSVPMGKTPKGRDVPDRPFILDPLL